MNEYYLYKVGTVSEAGVFKHYCLEFDHEFHVFFDRVKFDTLTSTALLFFKGHVICEMEKEQFLLFAEQWQQKAKERRL